MPDFGLDDDDRGMVSPFCCTFHANCLGSNGSSDNEQDELNEDGDDNEVDATMDGDGDDDGEGDGSFFCLKF